MNLKQQIDANPIYKQEIMNLKQQIKKDKR